jgi:putative colanic acid biosynthesis acetyltransferase WcaF
MKPESRLTIHEASAEVRGASPWSMGQRVAMIGWDYVWGILCRWTPKPANAWRLMWLRMFGAHITGRPFVHPRARIQIPWRVTLADGACVGDRANLYSLDHISLGRNCVIAQEAYLCTGSHDFSRDSLPLITAPIVVGEGAFVGARAFVLPGVSIGDGAVVGACSVVTRDVVKGGRVKGNPARMVAPAVGEGS